MHAFSGQCSALHKNVVVELGTVLDPLISCNQYLLNSICVITTTSMTDEVSFCHVRLHTKLHIHMNFYILIHLAGDHSSQEGVWIPVL